MMIPGEHFQFFGVGVYPYWTDFNVIFVLGPTRCNNKSAIFFWSPPVDSVSVSDSRCGKMVPCVFSKILLFVCCIFLNGVPFLLTNSGNMQKHFGPTQNLWRGMLHPFDMRPWTIPQLIIPIFSVV